MFAPKTKCQFFLYILIFFVFMALIPLINFLVATGGIIAAIGKKFDFERFFIIWDKRSESYMRTFMFIMMLPYHLILILGITAVAVVPGALIFPFMIIPSYYLNIRQYFSIMIYWWKGNRFQENADAEKMRPEVKARLL